MGCGVGIAALYLVSFQVLFTIIFLNLFVAVILEGFETSSHHESSNLTEFHLEKFNINWFEHDPEGTGLIPISKLPIFLRKIELPADIEKKGL